MQLVIAPNGTLRCLYSELLDLRTLGHPTIERASHVEPDQQGQWYVDLAPVSGPKLGPFTRRSEAVAAETRWLEANRLYVTTMAQPDFDSSDRAASPGTFVSPRVTDREIRTLPKEQAS